MGSTADGGGNFGRDIIRRVTQCFDGGGVDEEEDWDWNWNWNWKWDWDWEDSNRLLEYMVAYTSVLAQALKCLLVSFSVS